MGELWWQQISNARRFIENVIGNVKDGKNIILCLPETVPYINVFQSVVEEQLRNCFAQKAYEEIDLCFNPIEDVGRYMLDHYCKKSKRLQYRGSKTIGEFLGQSEDVVFHTRYFWVHNIPSAELEKWVDFIDDYRQHVKNGISPAVFILDSEDEEQFKQARGTFIPISFNTAISDYDKYAFCTIIAAENSCKQSMRDYLGQLASSCCGDDIEMAALCVDEGQVFLSNPIDTMHKVAMKNIRSNGMDFEIAASDEKLKEKIWTAQVRTMFPIIESARIKFINTYKAQIESVIKNSVLKDVYGNSIKTPYDIEVGMLVYMVGNKLINIPTAEYEKLELLRNVRNNLAHMTVTDYNLVDKIMGLKSLL